MKRPLIASLVRIICRAKIVLILSIYGHTVNTDVNINNYKVAFPQQPFNCWTVS